MRFLIDECLHESLVRVAHAAGFDATHVNHLGLSGKPDWDWPIGSSKMNSRSLPITASTLFGSSGRWSFMPALSFWFQM